MFLVVRTPRTTVGLVSDNIWGTYKNDWRGWNCHYRCISGIRLGLQWKWRTLDKLFCFLVLKPCDSGVRFAEVSFRNYLVTWGYMAGIGIRIIFIWVIYSWVVASKVQWMFGIFAVGL